MVPTVSYFRAVILECDGGGCDVCFNPDRYMRAPAGRRAARAQGWTYTRARGDRCPECSVAVLR
jgi:hypothetical protein